MTGLAGLSAVTARDTWHDHRVTAAISVEAARMHDLMQARTAVTAERLATAVLLRAGEMGVSLEQLEQFFGHDFPAEAADARARAERSPVLASDPALTGGYAALRAVRLELDRGAAGLAELNEAFDEMLRLIDRR